MNEIAAIVAALTEPRSETLALATLVAVEGSSYRRPGARLLVRADGSTLGGISGGCLESDLVERARRVIASGRAQVAVYDTTAENDLVWGTGLGCHGVATVVIEPVPPAALAWAETIRANLAARRATELVVRYGDERTAATVLAGAEGESEAKAWRQTIPPPPVLLVYGAGNDARPLVRWAAELGWHVVVGDTRQGHATRERFPEAAALRAGAAEELATAGGEERGTCAVVMTHRYLDDLALLRGLVSRPLAYLGVLGPRKRTERLLAELARDGVVPTAEQLAKLHAPVGLDLGGDGAEAVALAIVAELQAVRSGRAGGNLKHRAGPIHG